MTNWLYDHPTAYVVMAGVAVAAALTVVGAFLWTVFSNV